MNCNDNLHVVVRSKNITNFQFQNDFFLEHIVEGSAIGSTQSNKSILAYSMSEEHRCSN